MSHKCPYAYKVPAPQSLIDVVAKWDTFCLRANRRISSKSHPCYTERYKLCQWYMPEDFEFKLPKRELKVKAKKRGMLHMILKVLRPF